ncbi:MAG TPA: tripartite tricarboxylate transporter substrate-binding protein, partial [Casimicrobiaceae bacterium]|nr:tripartite tricarboxylate transporter substrate-binding protein [Casimicrobiaceae bacterium]
MSKRWSAVIRAVLCVCTVLQFAAAGAQEYPNRPIHLIVPVPPGGGVDLLSRAIGAKMSQDFGVPVVIDNKPGASAVVGTEALARSAPDGYTIMMGYSAHATNPLFTPNIPYDAQKDFPPIIFVGYIPLILVTPADSPFKSVSDIIAQAKAKPGQI